MTLPLDRPIRAFPCVRAAIGRHHHRHPDVRRHHHRHHAHRGEHPGILALHRARPMLPGEAVGTECLSRLDEGAVLPEQPGADADDPTAEIHHETAVLTEEPESTVHSPTAVKAALVVAEEPDDQRPAARLALQQQVRLALPHRAPELLPMVSTQLVPRVCLPREQRNADALSEELLEY